MPRFSCSIREEEAKWKNIEENIIVAVDYSVQAENAVKYYAVGCCCRAGQQQGPDDGDSGRPRSRLPLSTSSRADGAVETARCRREPDVVLQVDPRQRRRRSVHQSSVHHNACHNVSSVDLLLTCIHVLFFLWRHCDTLRSDFADVVSQHTN